MEVNSDYMYFQNPSNIDGDCNWIENSNPDSTDFSTYISNPWLFPQGTSNKYQNAFQFNTMITSKTLISPSKSRSQ